MSNLLTHHHSIVNEEAVIPSSQPAAGKIERLMVAQHFGNGRGKAQQLRSGMRIPRAFASLRIGDAKIPLLEPGKHQPSFDGAPPLLLPGLPAVESAIMGLVVPGDGGQRLLYWTPRGIYGHACGTYKITARPQDGDTVLREWNYYGIFDLSKEWPGNQYKHGVIRTLDGITYTLTRIYENGNEDSPKRDPRIPLRLLEPSCRRSAVLPT